MNLTHADLFETVLERVRNCDYAFDAKTFCHKMPNGNYPQSEAEAAFNNVAADAMTWFALSIEGRTTGWSLGDLGVPVRGDFSGTNALAEFLNITRDEATRLIYIPTPDDREANADDALKILREIRAKYEAQEPKNMITPGYRFKRNERDYTFIGMHSHEHYLCTWARPNNQLGTASLTQEEIECSSPLVSITTIAELTKPAQTIASAGEVWSYRGSNYYILRVVGEYAEMIATSATDGDRVRSVPAYELEERVGRTVLETEAA